MRSKGTTWCSPTCSEAPCLISRSCKPTRPGSSADFFSPKRVSSVGSCWSAGSSRVATSMRGSRGREGVGTTKLEEGTGTDELSGKKLIQQICASWEPETLRLARKSVGEEVCRMEGVLTGVLHLHHEGSIQTVVQFGPATQYHLSKHSISDELGSPFAPLLNSGGDVERYPTRGELPHHQSVQDHLAGGG